MSSVILLYYYVWHTLMYFYPGSSGIGGEFGEVDDFTSVEVLRQALAEGMTHIDTAPWYGAGKAETIIGKVKMCHLYLFPKMFTAIVWYIGLYIFKL